MKCQKCGANNANTHVKTVINGEIKEYDLCSECAKKMGYTNIFGNFEDEFSGLLEVSSATTFPQELRQHAVTSAEAHIPILQSQVMSAVQNVTKSSATSFFLQSEESTATQPIAVRTVALVQRKPKRVSR